MLGSRTNASFHPYLSRSNQVTSNFLSAVRFEQEFVVRTRVGGRLFKRITQASRKFGSIT